MFALSCAESKNDDDEDNGSLKASSEHSVLRLWWQ